MSVLSASGTSEVVSGATERTWPAYALGLGVFTLPLSARLTTVVLLSLVLVWTFLERHRLRLAAPPDNAVTRSLAALMAFALVSCLWAASPIKGFGEAAQAGLICAASFVLVQFVKIDAPSNARGLGYALVLGLLAALVIFLIEELSRQSIRIWLYNHLGLAKSFMPEDHFHKWANGKLVAISRSTLSRNVAPILPLMWASLLVVTSLFAGPRNKIIAVAFVAFTALVIVLSPHETSKVALVASVLIFAVAYIRRPVAFIALRLFWVSACLLVVPAALLAHKLDLQNASWLQPSAQHRILIWNFTAQKVSAAPFFGAGAYTTYVKGPELSTSNETTADPRKKAGMSRHAHNVFLQTWYELGLVGAGLLLVVGLALLRHIESFSAGLQPYALAVFTSSMMLMSSSYGMWQDWFLSLFALAPVFFAIGARYFLDRIDETARA